jgi:uncharacterized protein YdaU (DUF1376 family)
MKTTTWMPIYWGDYFKDTLHLNTEEHGAYMLLIGYYWCNGKIPRNLDLIKNVTRTSEKKLINVMKFFRIEGMYYIHDRIEKELATAAENQDRQRKRTEAASKARWQQKETVTDSVTDSVTTSPSPSPSPSPVLDIESNTKKTKAKKDYTLEFEEFWKAYPKNKASKTETFKSWNKITGVEYGTITRAAREYGEYLARTASQSYTAHATTWLNNARWEVGYSEHGTNTSGHVGISQSQPAKSGSNGSVDEQTARIIAQLEAKAAANNTNERPRGEQEGNSNTPILLENSAPLW